MIYINYIPVPLSYKDREQKEFEYEPGKTIEYYLEKSGFIYKNQKIILTGQRIGNLNEIIARETEEIIITPDVEGMIIPIVTTFFWKVGTWFGVKGLTATIVGGIATTATAVGVGVGIYKGIKAINAAKEIDMTYPVLQPMQQPMMASYGGVSPSGPSSSLDASSPTYGFDGIRMTSSVGLPIPIIYGKHRVGGNVINQYVWNNGNENFLNLEISYGYGEIESIEETQINDNPIANFDGITLYKRFGTNIQTAIPTFKDLHNFYTLNTPLEAGGDTTYTTSDSDVEAIEINFTMPSGLYEFDSTNGSIKKYSISIRIQYRIFGTSPWTTNDITITKKQRSTVRFKHRIESLTPGRYDVKITNRNATGTINQIAALTITSMDEIKTDDLTYPGLARLGVRAMATEQLSGGNPNVTSLVKGIKVSVPYLTVGGVEVEYEAHYWDPLTSQNKLFSDDSVCIWNGAFVTRWSANPVWCLKDLLINEEYGLGESINVDFLDDDLFLEMSRYCDEKVADGSGGFEKRFEMHVVLDSFTRAPDMISQLAEIFRGFAFMSGGKVSLSIDKASDPVQMFGMGNIVENSFSISKKSLQQSYNVIEVTFKDRDNSYQDETIAIIDEDSLAQGNPPRPKAIRHYSTKLSQAVRAGRYTKDILKYVNETVTLKAGIDAICSRAGDRVDVSHDVPQWGFSGRVLAGSTVDLVKLDRSVTIQSGITYKIQVWFNTNEYEEKTVTDGVGTYTELNVDTSFSQAPEAYDKYVFGQENIVIKPFRLVGFNRENNNEVSMSAIEYNASVYDDTAPGIPTNNFSALLNTIPDVSDLTLTERLVKLKDGTIENVIDVYFQKPDQSTYNLKQYAKCWIYLREGITGTGWVFQGESFGEEFIVTGNLVDLRSYSVTVVSLTDDGKSNAFDSSPSGDITLLGKTAKPSTPTNFDAIQSGGNLQFSVDKHPDVDFAKFRVTKSNGEILIEEADITEITFPVGEIGEQTYYCYAIDTSKNISDEPAVDTIIVTKPPEMNFLNEFDLFSQNLEYRLSGAAVINRNDFDSDYVRPVLSLASAQTWEEWEATGGTWKDDEANIFIELDEGPFESTGSYEMVEPLDLQTIFEFKVVLDADFNNVDNGSLAVHISLSDDDVSYSAFELISANSTYRGKYLKFKMIITTTDTAFNLYLYATTIFINAPVTLVDWVRDVAIGAGGTRINFGQNFTFPPRVSANIVNNVAGFLVLYDKTVSGVSAQIFADQLKVTALDTGEIDLDAKGY